VLSSIFSCEIYRIPLLNVMSNSEFFPGFLNFTLDWWSSVDVGALKKVVFFAGRYCSVGCWHFLRKSTKCRTLGEFIFFQLSYFTQLAQISFNNSHVSSIMVQFIGLASQDSSNNFPRKKNGSWFSSKHISNTTSTNFHGRKKIWLGWSKA
jgi:hypothetical protein